MRVALDSNVLLYALLEPDSARGERAMGVIGRAAGRGVLAVQALGEFLWVVRRKRPDWAARATGRVNFYSRTFALVETDLALLLAADDLSARHRVPFWDALILKASARGGAAVCLTEDMQDGTTLDGVRIVNPFAPANAAELERLLPPAG